jgi:hypothetical protein
MLHAGLAIEMAKAVAQERRSDAKRARAHPNRNGSVRSRPGLGRALTSGNRPHRAVSRPVTDGGRNGGVSGGSFEHLLSAAGAVSLLSIVLLGPIGLAVSVLTMTLVFSLGISPGWRRRRPQPARAVSGPESPEASDRWLAWRAVEPDLAYVGRRAA